MPKLIKKYLIGGFTPATFERSPYSTQLPKFTGNALGIDWLNASSKDIEKAINTMAPRSTGTDPVYKSLYGNMADLVQSNYNNISPESFNLGGGEEASSGGGVDMSGMFGGMMDLFDNLIPTGNSSQTLTYNLAYDMISNALMGTPAGWILKGLGIVSDIGSALGYKTDQVTSEDLFLDSKLARITPGGIYNLVTARKSNSILNDWGTLMAFLKVGSAYGNSMKKYDNVKDKAGKVIGNAWGQLDRWNSRIDDFNNDVTSMLSIALREYNNDLIKAQMQDRANLATQTNMNGGYGNIIFGRNGVKFDYSKLLKVHELLSRPLMFTLKPVEDIPEFKDGGKMNVIPEGSLHARLHHMENAEGLTKKGIPVVSIAEGGEMEQQAEIELNEIIFRLEVTLELEKLMQDGTDNAAIEAGKLLVKEIFENTDDRTGLLKLLEPEKKESTPEERVMNHEVFLKGGTLPIDNIDDLVDLAIKLNPKFVQRIGDDMGYAEFTDDEGKVQRGTHLLGYTEEDGLFFVFPLIEEKDGKLSYQKDWKLAFDEAKKTGNIVKFKHKSEAEKFTKEYKKSKKWGKYFDNWDKMYGSYKYGGIIEQLEKLSPDKLEELLKIIKYLNQ